MRVAVIGVVAVLAVGGLAVGGSARPAPAATSVGSAYQHPSEYTPFHHAAQHLGLSDSQYQKTSVAAVAFIFGISGITDAPVTAPGPGNHTITSSYDDTELAQLDTIATVMHQTRAQAQKTAGLFVAFLISLQGP
jgi:hypothetical protein